MEKENDYPTVFIAGDSTAAVKEEHEKPMTGWGAYIHKFLQKEVNIRNHAINGRSTKSFIDEGRLNKLSNELKAGDFLLIQFGHNDQKKEDPKRYAAFDKEYKENLTQFVETARKKGASPVLLTSVTRRVFLEEYKIDPNSLGKYPESTRDVADELQVPLLDIHHSSMIRFQSMGEEESKECFLHLDKNIYSNYPDGLIDDTHFSEKGAELVANLVAEQLKESISPLGKYLIDKSK
ncbi:rhamnogalacturonan acetylesterase [Marinilactibacillus sp. Marseille-P9653]|uniref:rhamnogalacturonan acetylesterase n=1 Tax=Marinilactibacillus sp. Marseille-P9653 TaxID=2866583 RepID=UPI001CE44C57|nr:rhamnogalacturonan acetylesterase [Marinilactibacillus sp. Marseille-P9653]